jgi:hypothetical protein
MADDRTRRAASDAVRRSGGPAPRPGSTPVRPPVTVLAPTLRQRAFVPLVWGAVTLLVLLILPISVTSAALGTAAVAGAAWLLAGRSAVLLGETEVVVRRPVGKLVLAYSDLREVERRKPALTERAELVRNDGRRVVLSAPQSGPLAALRDPAFDERLTLLRYRVARGARS